MLHNPYKDHGSNWLKGNLHLHCSESSECSTVSWKDSLEKYGELGYDFIAVTDHDCITLLDSLRQANPGLTLISGYEYSSPEHIVIAGPSAPPLPDKSSSLVQHLEGAKGALIFCAHPAGPEEGYWSADVIASLPNLAGIEIYNGHYSTGRWRRVGGGWECTVLWDELLSRGLKIWGFANDDFHDPQDLAKSANYVLAPSNSPEDIIAAFMEGAFYASSGLQLDTVHEEEGHVEVSVLHECRGRFMGPGSTLLKEEWGTTFDYSVTDEAYVRFEAEHNGRKLWLQPMHSITP